MLRSNRAGMMEDDARRVILARRALFVAAALAGAGLGAAPACGGETEREASDAGSDVAPQPCLKASPDAEPQPCLGAPQGDAEPQPCLDVPFDGGSD